MFRVLALFMTFVYISTPALAQQALEEKIDGPPAPAAPAMMSRDAEGRATMRTLRLPAPVVLDGRLEEAFYKTVEPIGGFLQQEPEEGAPATEKTDVWVFFNDTSIYVAARLWESEPSRRVTSDMRRDSPNLYNNDHFAVLLDTFYDRRSAYSFYANAQGGMNDTLVTNEFPNNNWNGLWEVRASTFDQGWTIEFRIPFRSLRFREGSHVWGINFRRMVRWKNEISFLTPVPASYGRRGLMMVSVAGTLVGVEPPANLRNIDVKPYLLGSTVTNRRAEPARVNDGDGDAGVDVKWGITQQLVADFTYNTDFAQVEDDEQQVNLTRFSLFFPEKREFFLEGQEIFNFGGAGGFGGGGGGGGSGGGGAGFGFGPNNTPVLFFSRRIGLSNGEPVPIRGGGRLMGRAGPYQFGALSMRTAAAPTAGAVATDFSVLRVNRDLFRRSRVGLLATRRAPSGASDNYAYGADASFNFFDTLSMTGYWARTDTLGRRGEDTSYKARYDWNADRYGLQAEHLFVGENFNPEAGFLRRQAFRRSYGQARFSPRPKRLKSVRKMFYEASLDYTTDPAGQLESREAQANVRAEMESGDQWNIELTRSFEALDTGFEVAKGVTVPAGAYAFQQIKGVYAVGPQRPISGFFTIGRGGFYDGTLTELSWRGRVELTSQLYLEPSVSWNRVDVPWGAADTNLVSTRFTYTLSPRMFVAALVQYQSRTDSMATNARFRWEYQPGSDLFVVYSDGRTTLSRGFPDIDNRSLVVKLTRLFRW